MAISNACVHSLATSRGNGKTLLHIFQLYWREAKHSTRKYCYYFYRLLVDCIVQCESKVVLTTSEAKNFRISWVTTFGWLPSSNTRADWVAKDASVEINLNSDLMLMLSKKIPLASLYYRVQSEFRSLRTLSQHPEQGVCNHGSGSHPLYM